MKKIAIFASGSGSNAENIITALANNPDITVDSIFCNVPDAYVLERAKKFHIPAVVFNRKELNDPANILPAPGTANRLYRTGRLPLADAPGHHDCLSKPHCQYPSGSITCLRRERDVWLTGA